MSKEQEAFGDAPPRAGAMPSAGAETLFAADEPSRVRAEDRRPRRHRADAWEDDGLGQPTVELDMETVLDEESARARLGYGALNGPSAAAGAAPVRALH